MPTINDTRYELEKLFINEWGLTTEIAYDNVPFDSSEVDEFVEIRFVVYDSQNMTIGSQLNKAIRHTGALLIYIYTKLNAGSGKAWAYADSVKDIMSNKQVASRLHTLETEIRRNGDGVDGYFSLICSVRYNSDEC